MTITAKLKVPRPATCPTSLDQLLSMIENSLVTFPGSVSNFGSTEPSVDSRAGPWVKTDAQNNILGVYTYSATHGRWVRDWGMSVGGFRTIYRTAATVSADREDKDLMVGWELADGKGVTGLDLTEEKAFFKNAGETEWAYYTLIFNGYA